MNHCVNSTITCFIHNPCVFSNNLNYVNCVKHSTVLASLLCGRLGRKPYSPRSIPPTASPPSSAGKAGEQGRRGEALPSGDSHRATWAGDAGRPSTASEVAARRDAEAADPRLKADPPPRLDLARGRRRWAAAAAAAWARAARRVALGMTAAAEAMAGRAAASAAVLPARG